ncbi:MAG: peptidoglycan-binding protein [Hyphomicrobiales bacterium]
MKKIIHKISQVFSASLIILTGLTPAFSASLPNPVLQQIYDTTTLVNQCSNKGFEAGLADWTPFVGKVNIGWLTSLGPKGTVAPVSSCTSENTYGKSCHMLESAGNDYNVGGIIPKVVEGGQSIRLGGNNLTSSSGYVSEGVAKRFIVEAGKEIYKFRFSALMFKAHDVTTGYTGAEPRFEAIAVDPLTGTIIDRVLEPASGYNFRAHTSPNDENHRYIPWTCAQFDLTGYTGKEVVVYFAAGDCGHGGHVSYAYLDDTCATCEVPEEPQSSITPEPLYPTCGAHKTTTIKGSFEVQVPQGLSAKNVNVILEIRQANGSVLTISNSTITGGNYSFDLDSSNLPSSGCFDLVPILTYEVVTPTGVTRRERIVQSDEGGFAGYFNDMCMDGETCEGSCKALDVKPEKIQCDATTGNYLITLENNQSGSFTPDIIELTSKTEGVIVSQNQLNMLEYSVSGATPGQSILLSSSATQMGAGIGIGVDLCCEGNIELTIPDDLICEPTGDTNTDPTPIDLSITKEWKSGIEFSDLGGSTPLPPHGFVVTIDKPQGTLLPGDTIVVHDPVVTQTGVASFGAPVAPAPWTCSQASGSWDCYYTVPTSGAVMPVQILWPAILDPSVQSKNCADVGMSRPTLGDIETDTSNNQACWVEDDFTPPVTDPDPTPIDLSITKEWKSGIEFSDLGGSTPLPPHGFVVTIDKPQGTLLPGDTIVVHDPVVTQTGVASFGAPVAPAPWTCSQASGSWDCYYTVPIAGAVMPVQILWPAILDPSVQSKNCADVGMSRPTLGDIETDTSNNQACWVEDDFTSTPSTTVFDIQKTCTEFVNGLLNPIVFNCEITVTTDGTPFTGNLSVSEQLDMGTSFESAHSVMHQLGSTDPWQCDQPPFTSGQAPNCTISGNDYPHNLGTSTINAEIWFHDVTADENCASAELDGVVVAGPSCANFELAVIDEQPEINLIKTCQSFIEGPVGPELHCNINVTTLNDFNGTLVINDVATQLSGNQLGQITSITGPNSQWSCTNNGNSSATSVSESCTFAGPTFLATDSADISVVMTIPSNDPMSWRNCASGQAVSASGAQVTQIMPYCETENYTPPTAPIEPTLTVTKTCDPMLLPDRSVNCILNVSGQNLVAGQVLGLFDTVSSNTSSLTNYAGSLGISSLEPWLCSGLGMVYTSQCIITSDQLIASGGSSSINWSAVVPAGENLDGLKNCVKIGEAGTNASGAIEICVPIQVMQLPQIAANDNDSGKKAILELVKTSTGPCTVNRAAQTYGCDFNLNLSNVGDARYSGLTVVSDVSGKLKPRNVRMQGENWKCSKTKGESTSCSSDIELEPGQSSDIKVSATIRGFLKGGAFKNCGYVGIGNSVYERAFIVQDTMKKLGIDGGPADGQPGVKTREGVRQLQERLGLDVDGEINEVLLSALGIATSEQAEPSCAIVDLPAMPRPILNCQKSTTVKKGNSCACRYNKMYRKNKTSCGCVKGTKFSKGEGCLAIKKKPVAESHPKPQPKTCKNGLPPLPIVGCVKIKINIGFPPKEEHEKI